MTTARAESSIAAMPAPATRPGSLAMRVDFAHAVGARLIVYGWVLGLSEAVASATLYVGDREVNLLTEAVRVKRPDVTQSFSTLQIAGDDHGFLAVLELLDPTATFDTVRLLVVLRAGNSADSGWPVLRDEAIAGATLRAHEGALRPLIPRLSARQKRVLAAFGSNPRLFLRAEDLNDPGIDTVANLTIHVQLCCVLPGDILVVGGVLPRPAAEARALQLIWDELRLDLLPDLVRVNEVAQPPATGSSLAYLPSSFLTCVKLPGVPLARAPMVTFSGAHGQAIARPQPVTSAHDAQEMLIAHLATVDAGPRLECYERISALLGAVPAAPAADALPAPTDARTQLAELMAREMSAAVKALPGHLDFHGLDYSVMIYLDQVIRVAEAGIYLTGWCYADPKSRLQVHVGDDNGFDLTAHWARWHRKDVDEHLNKMGRMASEDAGFFCFVPRAANTRPDYLLVHAAGGRTWRLRLPEPSAEAIPQAIRTVLASVDPTRRDLRRLLDRHVGPAVGALWAAHTPARNSGFINLFGPPCAEPEVSIVVPLYGRHDFADYQLALFADDPDFARVDLIYVVDDPSIVQDFRRLCHDLYGMHRVPFTLAYPGDNLGFAGASNYGAAVARAPHLLLLNSDVMPQQPGWLGHLLATYRAHPDTGLLGVKLLYEDGTVQHAGMVSRREPQLQDLWINHHPHKGMSPEGLTGVQEAECVTAACALLETRLYRELGGLSEHYIVGDFEDSDLCHRARARGRVNRVALDVTLYHLERQSQAIGGDTRWRSALTIYNCWLHNRRWGEGMGGAQS